MNEEAANGTHLIEHVSINTRYLALDDVYGRVNELRRQWGLPPDPRLDRWYQERKRSGPSDNSRDRAGRSHPVVGVELGGTRLTVEFGIDAAPAFDPPYQLIETFLWRDPEPDDATR